MAIAENIGLKELKISWNHFHSEGAVALAKGVGVGNVFHSCLKRWNLTWSFVCLYEHQRHHVMFVHQPSMIWDHTDLGTKTVKSFTVYWHSTYVFISPLLALSLFRVKLGLMNALNCFLALLIHRSIQKLLCILYTVFTLLKERSFFQLFNA